MFNRTKVEVFAYPEFIVGENPMIDSIYTKPYPERVKRVDGNTGFCGEYADGISR